MIVMTLNTIAVHAHRGRWAHVRQTVLEWRRRARSRTELMTVGERTLRDMGVSHASACFEASKPFWIP
jgi:uncharacterized protein YjiS (DUF1127 family)